MCFFRKLKENQKRQIKLLNEKVSNLILKEQLLYNETITILTGVDNYIDDSFEIEWLNKNNEVLSLVTTEHTRKYRKATQYKDFLHITALLIDLKQTLKTRITDHNDCVIKNRIIKAYDLMGLVEGKRLDEQQMTSIVKDAYNHLIIAGAGTGKTTTIVGKIKYLILSGKYHPEDIMVLSFTNASAKEMSERIDKELHCHIEASTFHKLGLNIIKEVENKTPKILPLEREFVGNEIAKQLQNKGYLKKLNTYLINNKLADKSEFDFESESEYQEYLELNPPTTMKKETVKSYGELEIANYLFQNNINYEYEKPYEIDTRSKDYGEYKPDFYLPDYGIYIEYFGINKRGEVPSYFRSKDGMTPSLLYQNSIEWKRRTHERYNTKLIECFAYEKFDDKLLFLLEDKLKAFDVVIIPKSEEELWQNIINDDRSVLDGITELFLTLINLLKCNDYSLEHFHEMCNGNRIHQLVVDLLGPIYRSYVEYLKENDAIDFNDMINTATKYVREGKFTNRFKYIIVDEYQDISRCRFLLLEALRKSYDYDLFCVGDDWQSIYRFAGSDIGYILSFEKYWGKTLLSRIETTYRFTKSLIEISGNFIMENTNQIKKSIKGVNDDKTFALGEINAYNEQYAINFMLEDFDELPLNSSVYLIGRYQFDGKMLQDNENLKCYYHNETGSVKVEYYKRRDLNITFMTAHKSKGLQADYVYILNNKKARMGFPSKIQDADIIKLLLDNNDSFPYSEERRLFYVAMTRAKRKTNLLTLKDKESIFAIELKQRYKNELKKARYTCPICGGRIIKKEGQYGSFYGCSNYSINGCKYTKALTK